MTILNHLRAMTIDGIQVPHEWYKALASKAGKSVSKAVRSRASSESGAARWKTRRAKYGKAGHSGAYERKAA